jgi:hypothetical protein
VVLNKTSGAPCSPRWSWNATETGPGRAFGRALFREAGIAWIADEDTIPGDSINEL